jgi:hypothetical protein
MHPLLADPWIAAQVEAAVAPYVGRLPASQLSWMRDQLAETLATDERGARLLRRARPVTVDESGEVRRDAGGAATPVSAESKAAANSGAPIPITSARRPKAR